MSVEIFKVQGMQNRIIILAGKTLAVFKCLDNI